MRVLPSISRLKKGSQVGLFKPCVLNQSQKLIHAFSSADETLAYLKKIFTALGHRNAWKLPPTLRRFKILPKAKRNISFWTFSNDEALSWFLHSKESEVPNLLKNAIRGAILDGDYVMAQQCSIRSEIEGPMARLRTSFLGSSTKNTFACFIGKKGQEEFALLLKMAIMDNHWLSWAMYQESLIFDLRKVEMHENGSIDIGKVEIYRMDGGLVPSPYFHIDTDDKIPGSREGEVYLEEIILHELVPEVRERKMARRERERQGWDESLASARRDDFFLGDALGKGMAHTLTFGNNKERMVFFIRGVALPGRLGKEIFNRLPGIENAETIKKISVFYHLGNLRVRLASHLSSNDPKLVKLHRAVTQTVADLLSYQIISDTHVDAGGRGSEHHAFPDRPKRLTKVVADCSERGNILVGNGDILDFWRHPWRQIRDYEDNRPLFEAMSNAFGYMVIGNHDLAAELGEIQQDFALKLGIQRMKFSHSLRFFTDGTCITHGHNGDFPYNFGPGLFNRGKRVAWIGKQVLNLFPWATSGGLEKVGWQFFKTTAALLQHQYFFPFNEIMRMQRNWDHAVAFLNHPKFAAVDLSPYADPDHPLMFGVLQSTLGEVSMLRGARVDAQAAEKVCGVVRHIQGHRHSMREVSTINQMLWLATQAEGLEEERIPVHFQSGSWTGKPMGIRFSGYKEPEGLLAQWQSKTPLALRDQLARFRLRALLKAGAEEWVTTLKPRVLDYPDEHQALANTLQVNHFRPPEKI